MIVKRRVDNHSHRIRRTDPCEILAEQLKNHPLNKLVPEHALVISLVEKRFDPIETRDYYFGKSYDSRLKPFLENNPFPNTEVIEAIEGMNIEPHPPMWSGDIACLRSHRKALQYANEKGWESVIIFEDDIKFVPDFNIRLRDAMLELPDNWDMLYLGGSDRNPPLSYSKNLKANACMWGGYALVLRNTVFDYFIDLFQTETKSCDDWYSISANKFICFKTANPLCIHIGKASERTKVNHERKGNT